MTTRTTAAVVREAGAPFVLEAVELDEPRPNEVLVRMVATGLCHTDLSAQAGALPFPLPGVLGHEGAGVVEEVGARVSRVAPGDHVLASFSSCGVCRHCRSGHPAYCASFHALNLFGGARPDGSPTILQGGAPLHGHFFGQSSLAQARAHRRARRGEGGGRRPSRHARAARLWHPDGRRGGAQRPAPRGGRFRGRVRRRRRRLRGHHGGRAVRGLAHRGRGPRSGAPGARPRARRHATPSSGATDDVVEMLREIGAGGMDYVVEATGSTEALSQAIQALAPRGTCAVLSTYPQRLDHPARRQLHARRAQHRGRLGGRQRAGAVHPDAGRALRAGQAAHRQARARLSVRGDREGRRRRPRQA